MDIPVGRRLLAASAVALALAGCGGGDEQPRLSTEETAGQQVFLQARCGSCHTLGPFRDVAGPNLDELEPDQRTVVDAVTNGRDGMPSYGGALSQREIAQVAAFVVRSARE